MKWIAGIFALLTFNAWADYSVLDTGEVMKPKNYKLTGATQFLTDSGGLNFDARADFGINDEMGIRGLIGTGKTDFFFGGMFKWMPIPDIDNQPAIGANAGILYFSDNSIRDLLFRIEPLVSKRYKVQDTYFTPYLSLPVGVRMRDSNRPQDEDTEFTLQVVAGTQLKIPALKNLQFIAEVGVDLNEAPGYFSVGAIYYFDPDKGLIIEQEEDSGAIPD